MKFSEYKKYNEIYVQQLMDNIKGVYVLATENKLFYVGSGDIKERLLAHLDNNEPNPCIKNYVNNFVCYFRFKQVLGGEELMRQEEQRAINVSNPECNKIDAKD